MNQRLAGEIAALRRYARVLTRDADLAEDLVQECLTRAIAAADRFRPDGDLRVWLFSILHNTHISGLRRRRTSERALEAERRRAEGAEPAQPWVVEARQVLSALADLPPDQQRAVALVAIDQLSYAEAAQVLDVPMGTFMSRLARGREALRRRFGVSEEVRASRPPLRLVKGREGRR